MGVLSVASACAGLLSPAPSIPAQVAALSDSCARLEATAPRDSSPIFRLEHVTAGARPNRANRIPSLGEVGRVVALEFVIDTLGRPDVCSARVTRESRPGLGDPFLAALPSWRYTAGERNGVKVRVLVISVFESLGTIYRPPR